jgi:hypothetical protein
LLQSEAQPVGILEAAPCREVWKEMTTWCGHEAAKWSKRRIVVAGGGGSDVSTSRLVDGEERYGTAANHSRRSNRNQQLLINNLKKSMAPMNNTYNPDYPSTDWNRPRS